MIRSLAPVAWPSHPLRSLALGALLAVIAAACAPAATAPPPLRVMATTTVLADLAAQVAGDRARVEPIAPSGAHVEEYEPTPDDARRVSEADVIVVNGLDLDAWSGSLLRNAKSGARTVTVTEGLPDLDGNPHLWFDLALAQKYVERIRDGLSDADPAGREGYASRASAYLAQLRALDGEIRQKVATIPAARRKLVTSHDAFAYYAKAYGLEVVGFTQTEKGKEPSAGELAALVRTVKAASVPAVFVEQGVSPRLAEALAREAGVSKVVTDLPTDSLGEKPADSFIGLMRQVTDIIVRALK